MHPKIERKKIKGGKEPLRNSHQHCYIAAILLKVPCGAIPFVQVRGGRKVIATRHALTLPCQKQRTRSMQNCEEERGSGAGERTAFPPLADEEGEMIRRALRSFHPAGSDRPLPRHVFSSEKDYFTPQSRPSFLDLTALLICFKGSL